jgi:hypothetical protein
MTYEEAQQAAIDAGALEPQGMLERMAYNWEKNQRLVVPMGPNGQAQGRLNAWTNAILDGSFSSGGFCLT